MVQIFKIKPNSYQIIKKQTIRYVIAVIVAFLLLEIIMYFIFRNTPSYVNGLKKSSAVLLSAIIVSIYINYINLKRIRIIFGSYKLSVTNYSLIREQENTPTLLIMYSDIKRIKGKNKNFIIEGADKNEVIYVSQYIENRLQVETILNEIKPITQIK